MIKPGYSIFWGLFSVNAIVFTVQAQITPDGTTGTTVTPIDNSIRIDNGDRAGDNLFHSFEQFSIPTGGEASFNNANDIVNIFSRVTGGDISNIDGLIRASGDANLFLINPAGIVFGEGASLDIGGSFFASTAESIVFSDDIEFSTTDTASEPLLTINQPLGLNLGNNPGDIAVNGSNLQVNSGETLALLGGNVTITGGQIIAPGANIELGGLTAAGQVSFTQSGDTFSSFSFPEAVTRGDVTLTNGAEVNVQASVGGNIGVNARNLELLAESNLTTGIAPESDSIEAQAGDISIDATGDITLSQGSQISDRVEESGIGNAGNIKITTTNLSLNEGSQVSASTGGRGNAGAITINASDTISAEGEDQAGFDSGIFSQVNPTGEGDSGGINITTANLSLREGGVASASTFGRGDAGAITINASDTISADGEGQDGFNSGIDSAVAPTGEGNSGGINITTAKLSLREGGVVSASTFAQGEAGAININASDSISVDGKGQDGFNSAIGSTVALEAKGKSGGIDITTANLSLTQGGTVIASTFGQGNAGVITIKVAETISVDGKEPGGNLTGIASQVAPTATGNSGGINITTTNLSLRREGQVSSGTFGQGDAGAITINASGTISADGEGQNGFNSGILSSVTSTGEGNAGGIDITTVNLSLTKAGLVSANTGGDGDAGNLTVTASESIELLGSDGVSPSGLFANTIQGSGDGRNLTIVTDKLIVRDEAVITVGNFQELIAGSREPLPPGTGAAGNLVINAGSVEVSNQGKITADNANGIGGNLTLNADSLTLENEASVSASTIAEEGQGGIVTLNIDDSLIMSNNSSLSARANRGADGGNLTINADSIVAFPSQNNDIIANAERGEGGNIDITTSAIFGLAERSSTPANNTNDIDASSEFGLDGTISINELEVNPAEGLSELPTEIIDVARLVAQNLCQQNRGSEFIVTGKGGIAPSPSEARDGNVGLIGLVEPVVVEDDDVDRGVSRNTRTEIEEVEEVKEKEEIVEAQGWIVSDRGILELVAHKTNLNSSQPQLNNSRICY